VTRLRYEAYRDSEVEWLGEVPTHWVITRARFHAGINPSGSEARNLPPDTEVSFVPMKAVGEWGGLDLSQKKPLDDVGSGYTAFRDGDVVVAKITPCFENGKGALVCSLANGLAFGTTELHVLRARDSVDARFLFYLTVSDPFRALGEAEMYGAGGQKRVPTEFVQDFPLPLPPPEEQRAIAAFLDRETARIDALVEKKRLLIERLEEQRTALISRTVTRGLPPEAARAAGLDPSPRLVPSGVEWLGDVPAHWEVKPLGRLVVLRGGATPDKSNPDFWDGDIPWVSPKDMKRPRISDSEDHITPAALRASPASLIPIASLLVVVRGMILAHSFPVALTEAPVTLNQDMKALLTLPALSPNFLFWSLVGLRDPIVALADESAHGTRKLETQVLTRFPIPLPALAEQKAIVGFLDESTAALDRLAQSIQRAIERLNEYRTALITAAVTGKIDVRESVSEEIAAG